MRLTPEQLERYQPWLDTIGKEIDKRQKEANDSIVHRWEDVGVAPNKRILFDDSGDQRLELSGWDVVLLGVVLEI